MGLQRFPSLSHLICRWLDEEQNGTKVTPPPLCGEALCSLPTTKMLLIPKGCQTVIVKPFTALKQLFFLRNKHQS